MKILIRFFFKTVRAILGPVLLILDKLTSPKGVVRFKVPCLKVMDENGTPIWLYESNDIISYLQDLADQQAPAAACATWQP